MRDDRKRLVHMLESIERVERYAARGEQAFRRDELIQTWMVRNIQVIGEAARALSQGLRDDHPNIPWSSVIGMRHVLVHDYFEVDLDIVWRVIERDVPTLKRNIRNILAALGTR